MRPEFRAGARPPCGRPASAGETSMACDLHFHFHADDSARNTGIIEPYAHVAKLRLCVHKPADILHHAFERLRKRTALDRCPQARAKLQEVALEGLAYHVHL